MRSVKSVCAVSALFFTLIITSFSAAQEKVPGSAFHGYMDIFQALEEGSFYEFSTEELLKFHYCAMRKIFETVKISKGTILEEDFVIPSCFTKDKYAAYHTPADVRQIGRGVEGRFFGIGAEIEKAADGIRVKKIIPGGPAEKTGLLMPNDVITAVADLKKEPETSLEDSFISLKDLPINEAIDLIIGHKETDVVLKVMRDGNEKIVQITRGPLTSSVIESQMLEPSIGYIKLKTFEKSELVREDVVPALEQFMTQNSFRALVINLEDNPGGIVDTTIEFLNLFAPSAGLVLLEEKQRQGKSRVFRTDKKGPYAGLLITVLVNANSASASELSAGVLQIWGAKVIGTKTFGKGSVQQIRPISGGGALRLTSFKFFFENGKTPDKVGVIPDIEVKVQSDPSNPFFTPQLKKAVEYLREELAKKTP